MNRAISIVIPNYNGERFLKACLDSCLKLRGVRYEIIIVDNGSTDGSIPLLRESYPGVRIIAMKENTGFAHAVNAGIRAARTPYVLLLNNDTKVHPLFARKLLQALLKRKDAFSVTARMIQFHDTGLLDDTGDFFTVLGWAFQRGTGQPVSEYTRSDEVFTACAGAAIYNRDHLLRLGGFDDRHFCYLEDVDIGWRARLFGFRNYYERDALVWHMGSATSGSRYNDFKVKLSSRNLVYLLLKNQPLPLLLLKAPFLGLGILVKALFFYRKGFFKAYMDGLREGWETRNNLPRYYREASLWNILKIEGSLLSGTVLYVKDFLKRKIRGGLHGKR